MLDGKPEFQHPKPIPISLLTKLPPRLMEVLMLTLSPKESEHLSNADLCPSGFRLLFALLSWVLHSLQFSLSFFFAHQAFPSLGLSRTHFPFRHSYLEQFISLRSNVGIDFVNGLSRFLAPEQVGKLRFLWRHPNNASRWFAEGELVWRRYTVAEALPRCSMSEMKQVSWQINKDKVHHCKLIASQSFHS